MEDKFENITKVILEKILINEEIQEPIFYEFNNLILKFIKEEIIKKIPNSFYKLSRYLENFWRASYFEDLKFENIFMLGRLFAVTNMMVIELESKENEYDITKYVEAYKEIESLLNYGKRELKEYGEGEQLFLPDTLEALEIALNSIGSIQQIKWERDLAISQLKELGYGLGEKIKK